MLLNYKFHQVAEQLEETVTLIFSGISADPESEEKKGCMREMSRNVQTNHLVNQSQYSFIMIPIQIRRKSVTRRATRYNNPVMTAVRNKKNKSYSLVQV